MTSRNIVGTIKKTKRWIVTIFSCFGFLLLIHGLSYGTGPHLMPSSYSLAKDLPSPPLTSSRMRRHVLSSINNGTDASLMSSVNVHYWDYICGYSVESLRSHPLFPFAPFRRDEANRLHLTEKDIQFGARMFGFIHPPRTGFYVFALSSDDASELWLSPGSDPLHVQLIASVGGETGKEWSYENQYDKYATQMSKEIELEEGVKYYFDALWKQERARGHIQVAWKLPDGSRFEVVDSRYISRFYDDSHIESGLVYLDHLKGDIQLSDLPSHVKQQEKQQLKYLQERKTLYERDSSEFLSLPIIDFAAISDVLPACNYHPSWIIEPNSEQAAKLGQYEGVHLPHYYNISTSVYPQDQTWSHTKECVGASLKPMHCQGNDVLSEQVATWVMNKYMTALSKRFPGRYVLHTLVNVEEAKDSPNGDRYLLEAALQDTVDKVVVRLSVYLYRPEHGTRLCYPKDFQWKKDAMVHFILTVKNQGPWVQQYIESLSKIVVMTKEQRFSLILTDFESFDTDIEGILQRSPIPNWKIIRKNGRFHKTSAIQEAVDSITDPNSIALQTDLHLEFPLNFIDDTRKHCVQGKMGYTPLLMRLACGRYSHEPAGFWEAFGYGIFAIYKSDWDHMGGMDVEKFRNAWGGEDWDFADRVIKSGIEIERLRVPYFFHFYHTKKGMWDNKY